MQNKNKLVVQIVIFVLTFAVAFLATQYFLRK